MARAREYWVGRYLYSIPKRSTGLVVVALGDLDLLPPVMLDYIAVKASSKREAISIYRKSGRWYATHTRREPASHFAVSMATPVA